MLKYMAIFINRGAIPMSPLVVYVTINTQEFQHVDEMALYATLIRSWDRVINKDHVVLLDIQSAQHNSEVRNTHHRR